MQLLAVLLDPLLGLLRSLLDVGKTLLVVAPIDISRYANISNRANDTEEQEELERLGSDDPVHEMDEKVLRAECLLAISSLSFEDLRAATKVILENGRCTLPLIQKNMGWGFGHTATIIENLERIGIISPKIENKITRKILINNYKEYEQFENNLKS